VFGGKALLEEAKEEAEAAEAAVGATQAAAAGVTGAEAAGTAAARAVLHRFIRRLAPPAAAGGAGVGVAEITGFLEQQGGEGRGGRELFFDAAAVARDWVSFNDADGDGRVRPGEFADGVLPVLHAMMRAQRAGAFDDEEDGGGGEGWGWEGGEEGGYEGDEEGWEGRYPEDAEEEEDEDERWAEGEDERDLDEERAEF
jgi:hypothetical protein